MPFDPLSLALLAAFLLMFWWIWRKGRKMMRDPRIPHRDMAYLVNPVPFAEAPPEVQEAFDADAKAEIDSTGAPPTVLQIGFFAIGGADIKPGDFAEPISVTLPGETRVLAIRQRGQQLESEPLAWELIEGEPLVRLYPFPLSGHKTAILDLLIAGPGAPVRVTGTFADGQPVRPFR